MFHFFFRFRPVKIPIAKEKSTEGDRVQQSVKNIEKSVKNIEKSDKNVEKSDENVESSEKRKQSDKYKSSEEAKGERRWNWSYEKLNFVFPKFLWTSNRMSTFLDF